MHLWYQDILSRIPSEPIWWLEGVPRYVPFTPGDVSIGATEVALVHTTCQVCRRRFDVGVWRTKSGPKRSLRDYVAVYCGLDIGDPPFVACCDIGPSMRSNEIAILEFWERAKGSWLRLPEMERLLNDAPEDDESRPRAPRGAGTLIHFAGLEDAYHGARLAGDREAMISMLAQVGCERPAQVIDFWEEERLRRELGSSLLALRRD